jgi:hypothetical protein
MRVSTEELRRAALLLLQHLDQNGQSEFEIAEDFYWDVPESARYAPYSEPNETTIGQLSDDWSEVKKILDGHREPLGYGLVWLSAVLRRIGETSIS